MAQAIEKNNELLLGRVAEMIEDARLAPHTAVHQRALSADTAAAPRSLNAEGASMWLEDDDGKIVIGADADTDLARAKESVLSTSGAFRVGDVGDDFRRSYSFDSRNFDFARENARSNAHPPDWNFGLCLEGASPCA